MPDARAQFACVLLDGKIYVMGGKHLGARTAVNTNDVQVFDLARGWAYSRRLSDDAPPGPAFAHGPFSLRARRLLARANALVHQTKWFGWPKQSGERPA